MLTVKQYYWKLKLEITIMFLKLCCVGLFIISSLWVLKVSNGNNDIVDKINVCLKTHSVNYCNKNIK